MKHGRFYFCLWMTQFQKEKSDKGILSRWLLSFDNKFITGKDVFISRMKKQGCTSDLIDIFDSAWNEFEQLPQSRIAMKKSIPLKRM